MLEIRLATLADLDAIVDVRAATRTAYYQAGGAPAEEIAPPEYGVLRDRG